MRVAFFVNRFPVLSEAFVVNALTGLLEAGAEVDVYALEGAGGDAFAFPQLERQARWTVNAPAGAAGHRLAHAFDALGAVTASYGPRALRLLDPFTYRKAALDFSAATEAALFRHRGQYDVLHCHFGTLARHVLKHRRAGLLQGAAVVHFRGYDITQVVDALGPRVYRRAFQEADWFVANCAFFRDRAVAIGCPPERITVVPSGVDTKAFAMAPDRGQPADGVLQILSVGRLIEKKGFADAIEAMARLRSRGLRTRYRIIGAGPLRGALEAQVARLGLEDVVSFLGPQPHSVVLEELRRAQLLVAPCVTGSDGAQDAPVNTLKEAMATGLPVVATRHGGIPELVRDGENGRLCAERDPEGLAAAIADLAGDPAEWGRLGRNGRELVVAEHSVEVADRLLRAAYANAIAHYTDAPSGRSSWTPARTSAGHALP